MRIVLCQFSTGASSREWIYWHWGDELRRAGHQLISINPYDLGTGLSRGEYDEFTVDTVAREHRRKPVSLFFALVRDREMSAAAVKRIGEMGVRTATLGDDDALAPHDTRTIAPAFDVYWVVDPEGLDAIGRTGARILLQPVAANPHFFRPQDVPKDLDITFCGQCIESRIYYVREMFRRGVPVEVYGVGWQSPKEGDIPDGQRRRFRLVPALRRVAASLTHRHGRTWVRAALLRRLRPHRPDPKIQEEIDRHAHPPLSFPEMARLYCRGKITLGFNERGHTHLLKRPLVASRPRDFEAAASGACHLMYRVPATQEHFEEDSEMLFYSSPEELADKARFYLDPRRESLRAEIGRRARERVLREHTWTHRFGRLFEELDLAP